MRVVNLGGPLKGAEDDDEALHGEDADDPDGEGEEDVVEIAKELSMSGVGLGRAGVSGKQTLQTTMLLLMKPTPMAVVAKSRPTRRRARRS